MLFLQENEAGRTIRNLFKKEWWTDEEIAATSAQQIFRVFHGQHDVVIEYNGDVVWQSSISVENGGDTFLTASVQCS
jgi:hypothetical protein